MPELILATTPDRICSCYPVMQQLRPALTEQQFVNMVEQQQQHGYQLLAAVDGDTVTGCAGFVVGYKLAWGKHIYIDDLVTLEMQRSAGIGKALLDWLVAYANEHDCGQIHLDSGVQRFAAHKFYLREHFIISSHHFTRML